MRPARHGAGSTTSGGTGGTGAHARTQSGFTIAAVLSLAIGIGANAAMFSVADGLLLRSLPVDRPDDLVFLNRVGLDEETMLFSHPAFLRLQQAVPEARVAARSSLSRLQLSSGSGPARSSSASWCPAIFEAIGVGAAAGRVSRWPTRASSAAPRSSC